MSRRIGVSPPPPGEDACEIAAVGSGRICEIRASKVPAAPPLCQRRCYDGHTLLFSQDKEDPFSGAISPVTERVPEVLRRHYMPGACRSAREPYEEGKCGFLRGAGDPEVLLIIRQNRLRDSAEPPGASGRNPLFQSFDGNNGLPDRCIFEAPSP